MLYFKPGLMSDFKPGLKLNINPGLKSDIKPGGLMSDFKPGLMSAFKPGLKSDIKPAVLVRPELCSQSEAYHAEFSLGTEEMISLLLIYPNGYRVTLRNGVRWV